MKTPKERTKRLCNKIKNIEKKLKKYIMKNLYDEYTEQEKVFIEDISGIFIHFLEQKTSVDINKIKVYR